MRTFDSSSLYDFFSACRLFKAYRLVIATSLFLGIGLALIASPLNAQDKGVATIRGKVAYDKTRVKSWDGSRLVVPYKEIKAKIRQKGEPKTPRLPLSLIHI